MPAWISLSFPEPLSVTKVALTFQGGFVARTVSVRATIAKEGAEEEAECGKVYPEDVSRRQVFEYVSLFECAKGMERNRGLCSGPALITPLHLH